MKEDKGKWEEIIRSKIYEFEVETIPEDWEALSAGLSGIKKVRLIPYRKILFTAVSSAAFIALLITGGLYVFSNRDKTPSTPLAVENIVPRQTEKDGVTVEKPVENMSEMPVNDVLAFSETPKKKTVENELVSPDAETATLIPLSHNETGDDQIQESETIIPPQEENIFKHEPETVSEEMTIDKTLIAAVTSETKRRRWGLGVGAGSLSTGSTAGNPAVSTTSRLLRPDEYLRELNTVSLRSSPQNATLLDPDDGVKLEAENADGKTKHKTPVSGGLGVSYYLSDRWTLQSGAVYTLLRSKGNYYDMAGNPAEWRQNLHFVGVPLSASYTIAEWKRIRFYLSAGGMAEWNLAGKIKRTAQVEGLEVTGSEKLRMKESLWSVNSRAGAVYPAWKFVNVYAEAGASYYFDNKSNIETIRSDKPFNVSLQAGIRLGF